MMLAAAVQLYHTRGYLLLHEAITNDRQVDAHNIAREINSLRLLSIDPTKLSVSQELNYKNGRT